ncbi:MAG TPA: thioredoxin [Firmicutes bacterium]|uniref:Thioredoxin n=1 Tax=Capillibacterium thermochitinicola TaxID=2699427 RepID=A0A8J6I2C1_9FIRM|nr:thioredoxin [Capillibacterium thermochitinicola]MBA2133154.1 thioredoxin [Capillibacterium thermochitinicola]HHW11696.1 thioredoxin [Bacillota bacterium]
MALTLNQDNFKTEVLDYKGVAMVDFWAPWCGPCRMVAPIIDQLAEEYAGKVKIGKVNTDENMALSTQYQIMTIPTMLIFKDGKVVDTINGALPKQRIAAVLDKWIS